MPVTPARPLAVANESSHPARSRALARSRRPESRGCAERRASVADRPDGRRRAPSPRRRPRRTPVPTRVSRPAAGEPATPITAATIRRRWISRRRGRSGLTWSRKSVPTLAWRLSQVEPVAVVGPDVLVIAAKRGIQFGGR